MYSPMLRQNLSKPAHAPKMEGLSFGQLHGDRLNLQTCRIELLKKEQGGDEDHADEPSEVSAAAHPTEDPEAILVPLPLTLQGPAAVAWQLLTDAHSTEEQIDAVALLALPLQKRFDERPDKTTHLLTEVVTAKNNHRALWLGGGGCGKTRTLEKVVEPLAVAFFGENGYAAAAQSNHAAPNLGARGRTLHAANGLLMADSLQTGRLRLNERSRKR